MAETPESRLDKIEGRLARVDAFDEKVSSFERRLEKLGDLERRIGDRTAVGVDPTIPVEPPRPASALAEPNL